MSGFFSHMELTLWPKISVVVFFLMFLALIITVYWPSRRSGYEASARLPLNDEQAKREEGV